jgi:DNA-binding response OmpR family regulator
MNKILLLEDLPEIRSWLKALALQVFPQAQVFEAARVHDALALITAERFEIAMIDLGPMVPASTWSPRCRKPSPKPSRSW